MGNAEHSETLVRLTFVVKGANRGSDDREVDVHHLLGGSGVFAEIFNDDGRARGCHLGLRRAFFLRIHGGATEPLWLFYFRVRS